MQNTNTKSPGSKIVNPIDDTAADPSISWGGSPVNSSGTGIRGNDTSISISTVGTDRAVISSTGVAVTGAVSSSTTMTSTGNFTVGSSKFTVTASSGNTAVAGTLTSTGDFTVGASKMTVASATGNTLIAGTLDITGAATALSLALGAGTAITKIIKSSISVTIPAITTMANTDVEVTVTGATAGDSVIVTPLAAAMEADAAILGCWVSGADKVKIRFANLGAGTLTGSTSNMQIMLVRS